MTTQLELPERARVRKTDPITSHLAANSVTELTEKQDDILFIFKSFGENGFTDEELWLAYNENPEVVTQSPSGLRSRRSELVTKGKLIDSGERRKTKSGRSSIVWCLA